MFMKLNGKLHHCVIPSKLINQNNSFYLWHLQTYCNVIFICIIASFLSVEKRTENLKCSFCFPFSIMFLKAYNCRFFTFKIVFVNKSCVIEVRKSKGVVFVKEKFTEPENPINIFRKK